MTTSAPPATGADIRQRFLFEDHDVRGEIISLRSAPSPAPETRRPRSAATSAPWRARVISCRFTAAQLSAETLAEGAPLH